MLQNASEDKWGTHTHSQLWRLLLSLFYHYGILHLVVVLGMKCIMGLEAERLAGWLRVATVYVISGLSHYINAERLLPHEGMCHQSLCVLGRFGWSAYWISGTTVPAKRRSGRRGLWHAGIELCGDDTGLVTHRPTVGSSRSTLTLHCNHLHHWLPP